ncbi:hypothetical protein U91I_00552 [alpha proteobacterium U9-1i]|nr:hypothetical protein U91I_00552 [alpha proteobacterium U9-1i]
MRRQALVWSGALALLMAAMFAPVWRLQHESAAQALIAGNAQDVFQCAFNIDQWPNWRPDVHTVRHLEGDGFRAELSGPNGVSIYAFDLDFEARTGAWQSRDERWRIDVSDDRRGARVDVSRAAEVRTLAGWFVAMAAKDSSSPQVLLSALAQRCENNARAASALLVDTDGSLEKNCSVPGRGP